MSTPAEESSDPLSLLRKQLILSQVQLLELEDIRDELQTALNSRDRVIAELQVISDRALAESQGAQSSEATAKETVQRLSAEREKLDLTLDTLRREIETTGRQLLEARTLLEATRVSATTHEVQFSTLTRELDELKSSWSWKWTKPVRWLGRLVRPSTH